MKYIRIHNWERFQHYKKRNPPWIKLHTELLDDDDFECLQDACKLLLICLWLYRARKHNGKIPADRKYLARKLPLSKIPSLQPLVDAGFIEIYQDDSTMLARCLQDAPHTGGAETETEERQRRDIKDNFFDLFEQARCLYPGVKRGGRTEFENLKRRHKDWRDIVPILADVIQMQIDNRKAMKAKGEFVPAWKHFQQYIKHRCWETEIG